MSRRRTQIEGLEWLAQGPQGEHAQELVAQGLERFMEGDDDDETSPEDREWLNEQLGELTDLPTSESMLELGQIIRGRR